MAHEFASILNPVVLNKLVDEWLIEDQPSFDLQALAVTGNISCSIYCKQNCVLAGLTFLELISSKTGMKIDFMWKDGNFVDVENGKKIMATISGNASTVLKHERLLLNIISRCSGVATITRRIKEKLVLNGWNGFLSGTRKTTPGFRIAEKFSLLVGGASCHRFDLSQMTMLKDNHIKIAGGIKNAVALVKRVGDFTSKLEVECSSLDDAIEAAECGADIIMLDNFIPLAAVLTAEKLKKSYPSILIEVSGGISEQNVLDFAVNPIDIISMSCLVQGYPTIDFSMKVD